MSTSMSGTKRPAPETTGTDDQRLMKVAKIINATNQSVIVRACAPPADKTGILVAEPVLITSWREQEKVNQWCEKLLPPLTPASQVMRDLQIQLTRHGQRLGLSLGERAGVVVVTAAEVGEPGAVAGALAGDVLVTVGDESGKIPVSTVQEMVQALQARSGKQQLQITVRRDVWEPHQTEGRATIGGGAPASVCGLCCQMCPPWWQKDGEGGGVVQVIQLYSPVLGSLVYSTGGGAIKDRRALPSGLQKVLGHSRLIKVGVHAHQNAIRIANDFGVVVTGVHNLMGGNLQTLSVRFCPQDLHLSKISPEHEMRSHEDWVSWPLSGEQAKHAALSAVVSYWVCASKRGGQWPSKPLVGTIDDLVLAPPVVPKIAPQLQQQIRGNKTLGGGSLAGTGGSGAMPYKGTKSDALNGHSILVSGQLTSVTVEDFNTYIAEHGALVCGTMMKDLTTLIVSDRGKVSEMDQQAAAEKNIPVVDLGYVFDLVRTRILAKSPNKEKTSE